MKLKELRKLAADLPGNLYGSPISNQTNPTVPKNSVTQKSAIDDESVAALAAQQGPARSMDEFEADYAELSGRQDFDLQRLYSKYIAARKPIAKSTAKPAATKGTAVIDQNLWGEELSDQPGSTTGYTYKIGNDGKSLTYKETGSTGQMKPLNQSYSQWDKVVIAINALGAKQSIGTPQADNAKTDPTATPQNATTKPAEATAPVITSLVTNIAQILSNVRAGSTYAGKTVFRNEKGMVKAMLTALDASFANATRNPAIKAIGSAPNALALIIAKKNAPLENGALASAVPGDLAKMNDKQISKAFQRDLDIIMATVRELHAGKFVDNVDKYVQYVVGTVNATTPQQPTVQQTSQTPTTATSRPVKLPEKASSQYPAKIIRLASIRKLRVRSEMEAAITGSAMPGRDRVI